MIAKSVGSPPGSIFSILLPFGGIYQPPQRRRATALSLSEREEISRGVAAAESYRAIGRRLGRPASTISREVARNRGAAQYRAVPRHWEGDLLLGRHWTQLATLVERTTRFTVLVQLAGRDMDAVTAGLSREMAALPGHVRRSLAWDRGMERAGHAAVTANTGLDAYFADPHSPRRV